MISRFVIRNAVRLIFWSVAFLGAAVADWVSTMNAVSGMVGVGRRA